MTHPTYHNIVTGMEFKEQAGEHRIVAVVNDRSTYHVDVKVLSGPGVNKTIQKPRKQMADPTKWRYLGDDKEEPGNG